MYTFKAAYQLVFAVSNLPFHRQGQTGFVRGFKRHGIWEAGDKISPFGEETELVTGLLCTVVGSFIFFSIHFDGTAKDKPGLVEHQAAIGPQLLLFGREAVRQGELGRGCAAIHRKDISKNYF